MSDRRSSGCVEPRVYAGSSASMHAKENVGDVGSDAGSEAPWGAMDTDRLRVQVDQLHLASAFAADQASRNMAASDVGESDDEDKVSVSSGNSGEREKVARRGAAYADLVEAADRLVKVSAMQMVALYRRGRYAKGGTRVGAEVNQKVFGLEGSEVLTELDSANGLYDRLMQGDRVVTQYVARTGIGKTTRFAAMVAKKCAMRVLLLQPDVLLAKAAGEAQRDKTNLRTSWSKVRGERLVTMTYHDFCGQFMVKNGMLMLEQFDVVMMDEAHLPYAEVYATKALLATYAPPTLSLLVLSATMAGEDSQAINNAVSAVTLNGTLVHAVESGSLLTGARALDRTMWIVATDEDAMRCFEAVNDSGHEAFLLDSASRASDCEKVRRALGQPSLVKRFLVVTEKYGTGHNFPVSQVYSDCARRVYRMDPVTRSVDACVEPVTVSEVKQHVARVGRGMVQGNKSYTFFGHGEALFDVELLESEKLRAYFLLRAAGVRPLKSVRPEPGFIPFGVTPDVAAEVLAVGLPCEVAIRFFAKDGRVPVGFARGLERFSQLQHRFVTSQMPTPIGYEDWVDVSLGGYYGCESYDDVVVKLPFNPGDVELRVKMLAVVASARGDVAVKDWMPQLSDAEVSEDEVQRVTVRSGKKLPRLVLDEPKPLPALPRALPWSFDAEIEGQRGFGGARDGMVGVDSYTRATLDFLHTLDNQRVVEVPTPVIAEAEDSRGVQRVKVLSDTVGASPVEVATPGGSVVVTLRKDVWVKMASGEPLDGVEFFSLIRAIRDNVAGFVKSNVFANWSNAWLSFLRTCSLDEPVEYIQHRGAIHVVPAVLNALYVRYTAGVNNVVEGSYQRSKFWRRVVSGRTIDEQLKVDRARGKSDVIQSEAFFRRVGNIRACTTAALRKLEEHGIFSPSTVTDVQTILPISSNVGCDMIDEVSFASKGAVRKRMNKVRSPDKKKASSVSKWFNGVSDVS